MKIAFNAWRDLVHPSAGGSEVIVDRLITGLSERGHDVTLRAGRPLTQHAYPVIDGGGTYTQYLTTPLHHHRHYRGADVIVDVINGMGYYTPIFSRTPVVGLVHHIHTQQWAMYYPRLIAAAGRLQERQVLPRAYRRSLFACISPSTRRELIRLGVPEANIRPLPIACTLEAVDIPPRSETPLFVAAGRLTSHKRIDLLLRIWSRVQPRVGGRLVILGEGPERSRLERMADSTVEFTGHVSEATKATWFHQAWLLVHAAPWEGWGLVITEAALAATPSLAFDVVGVRDAIVDGRTGLLAATEEEYAQRWITLANDAPRREMLGQAAQRHAVITTSDALVDDFEAVLIEAVSRRRPTGAVHPQLDRVRSSSEEPRRPLEYSIVIPSYNEAERLPRLLEALAEVVDVCSTEILVVDDGSIDRTAEVAAHHLDRWPAATVLRLSRNTGKGAALRLGVRHARGARVVFMDADLATDLEALPRLLVALTDHHLAVGSRTHREAMVYNGATHRMAMGAGLNRVVRSLTSVDLRDTQCGFKAFRGPVARLLFGLSRLDGFAQDVEVLDLAARLGLTVGEVPVHWSAVEGSKVRPVRDSLATMSELVRHRLQQPTVSLHAVIVRVPGQSMTTLAKQVGGLVRSTDILLAGESDVRLLFASQRDADLVSERLQQHLGERPRRRVIRLTELLRHPSEWPMGDLGAQRA